MEEHIVTDFQEEKYETLIQGLIDDEFGFCDDFLPPETVEGLRNKLLEHRKNGAMFPAGVGKNFDFKKNAMVRGDVIYWLAKETTHPFEQAFFKQVEFFIAHLNQTCYTSINDYEFHYAYYEVNSFYKRHLDQFKNDKARKFSLVMYLNEDWSVQDGGQLSLYTKHGDFKLAPEGGRCVFFKSDEVEHEVHPSLSRYRLSIAGWLKNS